MNKTSFSEKFLLFVTGLLIGTACGIVLMIGIDSFYIGSGTAGLVIGFSFGYWIKFLEEKK